MVSNKIGLNGLRDAYDSNLFGLHEDLITDWNNIGKFV